MTACFRAEITKSLRRIEFRHSSTSSGIQQPRLRATTPEAFRRFPRGRSGESQAPHRRSGGATKSSCCEKNSAAGQAIIAPTVGSSNLCANHGEIRIVSKRYPSFEMASLVFPVVRDEVKYTPSACGQSAVINEVNAPLHHDTSKYYLHENIKRKIGRVIMRSKFPYRSQRAEIQFHNMNIGRGILFEHLVSHISTNFCVPYGHCHTHTSQRQSSRCLQPNST